MNIHNNFFENITHAVSEARLAPYSKDNATESTILARYLWNTALCESLYPCLNGLEIALRNSLHNAITEQKSNETWFETILVGNGPRELANVKKRLNDQKKEPIPGQIVAGFNFGFWTHLFNKCYEGSLWPWLLKDVFSHAPPSIRRRNKLSARLNKFRLLRNRISHHEPIWYWEDLPDTHQTILDVTSWINPAMGSFTKLIDRFPEIHSQGVSSFQPLILDN